MRRQEQLEHELRDQVGSLLAQRVEFPEGTIVTVSRAAVTADARSAAVYLLVLPPERGLSVLELLDAQLYDLQGALYERLDHHPVPRIRFALEEERPLPND
ncbi:MAG: ribosome-binding factor A [bacterium]|nr:ribosome-binding factor A [bacterium]